MVAESQLMSDFERLLRGGFHQKQTSFELLSEQSKTVGR